MPTANVLGHIDRLDVPINGTVRIPGSKSFTNRAIILAMATEGTSFIRNPLRSDDTRFGIEAARAAGCTVHDGKDELSLTGLGRVRHKSEASIEVGSAGTIARFLPPFLAFGEQGEWTVTASAQMSARPMEGLISALSTIGADIKSVEGTGRYPLTVRGGARVNGTIQVDGSISSQYLSGILLAAPLLKSPSIVTTSGDVVQKEYVRMTLDCMRQFGAEVSSSDDLTRIEVGNTPYVPTDMVVEADASTASYFAALPAILGGIVELPNLSQFSSQPDTRFLEILTLFGCTVTWLGEKGVRVERDPAAPLVGGHVMDLNDCSDVALTVAAVSVFADAPVEIRGVEHIRYHECDRIEALTAGFAKMGIGVKEHVDGWTIHPGQPQSAVVSSYEDHRVAMALSIVGLGGSGVFVDQPHCVAKTCPEFYDLLSSLGAKVNYVTDIA